MMIVRRLEINQICACFHEERWFHCRVLKISSDLSTATVVYLDWGMLIPVKIEPTYISGHHPRSFLLNQPVLSSVILLIYRMQTVQYHRISLLNVFDY